MTYYKDTTYYLELTLLNKQGNKVSGQVVTYNIYKSSDNNLFKSGTLSEIGITGVYKDSVIFTESIQYRVEYTTPNKYNNAIETFLVVTAGDLGNVDENITRILGLCQENFRILNPTYDKTGNLLSGKIKIYPSASDVDTDTNAIAEYEIKSTYDRKANVTGYKSKKIG